MSIQVIDSAVHQQTGQGEIIVPEMKTTFEDPLMPSEEVNVQLPHFSFTLRKDRDNIHSSSTHGDVEETIMISLYSPPPPPWS
jgi:hypothetical protein